MSTSRIPGFHRLSPEERVETLERIGAVGAESARTYRTGGLEVAEADHLVENVVGTLSLPCGVGLNLVVNGVDRIVPMVMEEPSVVAALSNSAKLARQAGGFRAEADDPVMIGQVQLAEVDDVDACVEHLEDAIPELSQVARSVHPQLEALGGGLREMRVRRLRFDGEPPEDMVVLHFHLHCVDAMGANMVNTVAERLAPEVERLTGERVGLRILTNLSDQRLARARLDLDPSLLTTPTLDGSEVARRIEGAWRFAWADRYRAATHNKGVMNGIDALALATGNDWRAQEAGAHAWAARDGRYRPLSSWRVQPSGVLRGSIELPIQMGVVGGAIRSNPTVRANLELLAVSTSGELAEVAAAVGLAQNLAALRALATDGIQRGHMRMHARNVAASAGARDDEVSQVAARLLAIGDFSRARATTVLDELRR